MFTIDQTRRALLALATQNAIGRINPALTPSWPRSAAARVEFLRWLGAAEKNSADVNVDDVARLYISRCGRAWREIALALAGWSDPAPAAWPRRLAEKIAGEYARCIALYHYQKMSPPTQVLERALIWWGVHAAPAIRRGFVIRDDEAEIFASRLSAANAAEPGSPHRVEDFRRLRYDHAVLTEYFWDCESPPIVLLDEYLFAVDRGEDEPERVALRRVRNIWPDIAGAKPEDWPATKESSIYREPDAAPAPEPTAEELAEAQRYITACLVIEDGWEQPS